VRYRRVGSFTRRSPRTTGATRFDGRVGRRLLPAGRYRLVATASERGRQRSHAKTLTFRVKQG
jgi:hypothetical protein